MEFIILCFAIRSFSNTFASDAVAVDQAFASLRDVTLSMTQCFKEIGDETLRVERDMNRCIETLRRAIQTTPGMRRWGGLVWFGLIVRLAMLDGSVI
jgi:hypothetical protein